MRSVRTDGQRDPDGRFYILALCIMELEIGVLRVECRDNGKGTRLRAGLEQKLLPEFAERTLDVDSPVATRCASLHMPYRRADRDALMAETALVHGMSVITRHVREFRPASRSSIRG